MVDRSLEKKLETLNSIGKSPLLGKFLYHIKGNNLYKSYEEVGNNFRLRTKEVYRGGVAEINSYLLNLLKDFKIDRNYTDEDVAILIGALNRVLKGHKSYALAYDNNRIPYIIKRSRINEVILCKCDMTSCFNCLLIDKNEWRIKRLGDRNGDGIGNTAKT